MIKLSQAFESKNVRVADIHGKTYVGHVGDYIYADDNVPEEIESIVLNKGFKRSDGKHLTYRKEIDQIWKTL